MPLYAVICQRIGSRKIIEMSTEWTNFGLHTVRHHTKRYSWCLFIPLQTLWTQIRTNKHDMPMVMSVLIWVPTVLHPDGTPGRTF